MIVNLAMRVGCGRSCERHATRRLVPLEIFAQRYLTRCLLRSVALVAVLAWPAAPAFAALELAAQAEPSHALAGERVVLTIHVANPDAFAASDLSVSVGIPDGIAAFFDASAVGGECPGTTCDLGETLVFALGALAPGAGAVVRFTAVVAAGAVAGTSIVFPVDATDAVLDDAAVDATVEVDAVAPLELLLVESANPAAVGDEIAYAVTFAHRATARFATDAMLSFDAPPGTTVVAVTDGGTIVGNNVTWSLGTLGPGQAGVRTATVQVDVGQAEGTLLVAEAELSDAVVPAGIARAQAVTRVQAGRTLQVEITAAPDPVAPEERVAIVMTASQRGVLATTDVTLDFMWPPEFASMFDSLADGGACPGTTCDPGELIVYSPGDLAVDDGAYVRVPPVVAAVPPGRLIDLMLIARDASGDISIARAAVIVDDSPSLELLVAADANPVAPGDVLTYTVTFGHRATARFAPDASLLFTAPAGTTLLAASDGGVVAGNQASWALGTLSPGQAGRRSAVVQVDAQTDEASLLCASASLADAAGPPEEARAAYVARVASDTDLVLAVEATPDPVMPGERIQILMTVANRGPATLLGVEVELFWPDELTFIFDSTLVGGACPGTTCDSGESIVFALGDIPAGDGRTVSLPPPAAAVLNANLIHLHVRARDSGTEVTTQSPVVIVDDLAALELLVWPRSNPAAPGDLVVYDLAFGHRASGRQAPSTSLSFTLADGTTFVSASDDGALDVDTVTWPLGTLAPGAAGTRTVTVQVGQDEADGELLVAGAAIADADAPPVEACAAAALRVKTALPLALAIEAAPDPVRPEETVQIQLTASNRSPLPLLDVVVELVWPEEMMSTFESLAVGGDCAGTTCDVGETISFALGNIPVGEGRTVTLPPVVGTSVAAGSVVDLRVRARNAADETVLARTAVLVDPGAAFELRLSDDVDPAADGDQAILTATFGHVRTGATAVDSMLLVRVPVGMTIVGATPGANIAEPFVLWDLGDLLPRVSGRRQVFVDTSDATEGDLLSAHALVLDSGSPIVESRAVSVTRIETDSDLLVAMDVEPDGALPGDTVTVTVEVTNRGLFGAIDVDARVRLPDDIVSFFESTAPAADCAGTTCDVRENLTFSLGTIASGTSAMASFDVPIASGNNAPALGGVVRFEAVAEDAAGVQAVGSRTLRIGFGCGDTNADGAITATDALAILRAAVGLAVCEPVVCDVDDSGAVTATDALIALRISVALGGTLSCGPLG